MNAIQSGYDKIVCPGCGHIKVRYEKLTLSQLPNSNITDILATILDQIIIIFLNKIFVESSLVQNGHGKHSNRNSFYPFLKSLFG